MEQVITSRKNPLLQQVRKLLSSRKAREEAGLYAADGIKLLAEAVRYCPGLDTVILSEGVEAELPENVRLIRVPTATKRQTAKPVTRTTSPPSSATRALCCSG